MLTLWIQFLANANVDLEEYGRMTKDVHISEYQDNSESRGLYEPPIKLVGFTYGPNIDDWTFYLTEDEYPWAAEFWDMLDHPERAMPGAWHDSRTRQLETTWHCAIRERFGRSKGDLVAELFLRFLNS
jgi:hypothetical protein